MVSGPSAYSLAGIHRVKCMVLVGQFTVQHANRAKVSLARSFDWVSAWIVRADSTVTRRGPPSEIALGISLCIVYEYSVGEAVSSWVASFYPVE